VHVGHVLCPTYLATITYDMFILPQVESNTEFMTIALERHIESTPGIAGGKPRIVGHRITVQNIAIWHERMGKSADEICTEYGLTLAEVYAALAFYYDHQAEIDRSIEEQETFVAQQRQCTPSVLAQKRKARRGG